MASAQAPQCIHANQYIRMYEHDPDGTSATLVTGAATPGIDMSLYSHISISGMTTVSASSSGISKVEIIAADDAALTTNVVVVEEASATADAVGDTIVVEATAEQIGKLADDNGYDTRYAGARLTCSNSGDEAAVTYVALAERPQLDLTANVIS